MGKGSFNARGAGFNYSAGLEERSVTAIARLADDISAATGKMSSVAIAAGVKPDAQASDLKGIYFLEDKSLPEENYRACLLDGTRTEEPAMHPTAITACCAASVIAGESEQADMWLKRFAALPLRKGPRRYYDNCLYFFALLMLSGKYSHFERS